MLSHYNWKKILGAAVVTGLFFTACKKLDEGFLSDGLYVPDAPITIQRGLAFQKTEAILPDGSTRPITFELLDVRRADTKKHADEFFKEYPVYVYTAAIDPAKDTTIEQVNKKRELKNMKPFTFLASGQWIFNGATDSLPLGVTYEYDIRVTNVAGTKEYKNIATLTTADPPLVSETTTGCNFFPDDGSPTIGMGAMEMKISRIKESGATVILKITDKDGKPFNPKNGEIIKRGDRPTFESYSRFHPVEYTDTSMICNFEIAPFPIAKYSSGGTNFNYLIYYRIPSTFATVDKSLTTKIGSVNPLFAFRLMKAGTYLVEIRLPKTTRISK
ncbi:protein of unknown function [Chitinophaga terrae (ex Kim and Jung 2007)]|uniref:DUF5007 domain-containing protein n=1 Tax=Chitinophaga terrae (ex Kim and Jung 2007) TaxID=408074 RepID=A0A1H3YP81_9BACT|nr:DUF5007 domain-containing protein [Chitinophaga terrae (ex Kim and Jung 2007)]MDQ0107103.1 hypothetical protein [Chitinophaga terrae (ex Kim and Jung 2007)]GEP88408.1 hypothetical protein CTE07_00530 [Chitinophaga terrae (ex Kim and Jung 2007)]SEA12844.1 protein of unknown function [Chitinophaga terrae (ex Kim and Jung 2007)]